MSPANADASLQRQKGTGRQLCRNAQVYRTQTSWGEQEDRECRSVTSLVQSSSGHVTRHECCAAESINAGFVVSPTPPPHTRPSAFSPALQILPEKATVKGAEQVTHLVLLASAATAEIQTQHAFDPDVQDEAV